MPPIIDIHSHILPGLDDGSDSMELSMEMMRIAYEDGVRGIIVTPHFKPQHHNASPDTICELMQELHGKCAEKGIKIKLFSGNELYYHSDMVDAVDTGRAQTLAGSKYLLVEFNPQDDYDRIRDGLYSSLSYGYMPILAHVERYENVITHTDRVMDLCDMGCYIQVNAGSIMGSLGYEARTRTRRLLQKRLVHFVASDAHDAGKRSPRLIECAEYIYRKYGDVYAKELFSRNPAHVIMNEII